MLDWFSTEGRGSAAAQRMCGRARGSSRNPGKNRRIHQARRDKRRNSPPCAGRSGPGSEKPGPPIRIRMRFDELDLAPELVRNVTALGYETPTPIQQQAIPL